MALDGPGFARRLRAVARGLTQAEIASLAGVTQQDVSRYLRGRIPQAENLLKLSSAFGVSPAWLLTGRELPARPAPRKPLQAVRPARPSRAQRPPLEAAP